VAERPHPAFCMEESQDRSALTQRACIVSDLSRIGRGGSAVLCPRCRTTMDEGVGIAPIAGEPGLTAYEPQLRYVASVLQQPKDAR
jgi:hypothetical protein